MKGASMKFRNLLTVAFLMLTVNIQASPLGENPFGFKMGITQDDVRNLEGVVVDSAWVSGKTKVLTLSKVPVPDARFVTFNLYFTEKHGLYTLQAMSNFLRVGTGGQDIMPKYVALREELAKIYDKYTKYGFTKSAYVDGIATWETGIEWALQVRKGSGRHDGHAFVSNWLLGLGGQKQSEQLSIVGLSIRVWDPANLVLTFGFRNMHDAGDYVSNP